LQIANVGSSLIKGGAGQLGPGNLGPGSCHVHGDKNIACLIKKRVITL